MESKLKVVKRKSNFDVDNAANVISGIVFTAILLAVLLLVVVIIFGLNIFQGSGSIGNLSGNVSAIQNGIISMIINFFSLMPTIGIILAVVILISVILLLVLYVRRMASSGQSPTSGFQG